MEQRKAETMRLHEMKRREERRGEMLYKDVDLWGACFVLEQQGRILCHCPPTLYKVREVLFVYFVCFISLRG
jgi:hypothetical protein